MERRKGIERMRGGPEQSCTNGFSFKDGGDILASNGDSSSGVQVPSGDISDSSSWLLELAADNDLEGFRQAVEEGKANVDVVGSWYSRHNATTQMVLEQRTPAMIAALYGSLDVLMYIGNSYAASGRDIDETCGTDGNTALHCAAAGGSVLAVETVKVLLDSGAKLDVLDAQGRRPADVIRVSPRLAHLKVALENMLNGMKPLPICSVDVPAGWNSTVSPVADDDRLLSSFSSTSGFVVSRAIDAGVVEPFVDFSSLSSLSTLPGSSSLSPSSSSLLSSSPRSPSTAAASTFGEGPEKGKEEYPIDTCIPDIKNSIYMTDEFRMFSFKVRPCSRAYSHDWTECPFVHPGENARRRDPRRYHYSCVPCPDFRKGSCRLGDACEYAHGVFESWLHPAQYRTRVCKDGTGCVRRVCFFAHTTEELRPLYVSTDSAGLPSRTTACLDMAAVNQPLTPSSPSVLMRSPFSPSNPAPNLAQGSHPTPPMSPSSPSLNSGTWSQPNVPPLHLPGASLHASRLRAALNARDMTIEELTRPSELDEQLMNELTCVSSQALCTQARLNAAVAASAGGSTSSRAGKYKSLGPSVAPTNLEELFASEIMSSPRSVVHDSVLLPQMEAQMLSHKYTHLHSQLQNQLQAQITSQAFPQVSAQSQLHLQQAALNSQSRGSSLSSSPVLTSSLNLGTLGRMSALGWMDAEGQGKHGVNGPSVAAARIAFAQCDKRSHSSRDLGAGLALSDWGSPTGKPEWGVQGDDLLKFRKSASFGFRGFEEPYLLWAQKLKEGTLDADVSSAATDWSGDSSGSGQTESIDHYSVLGSWIDKMQLDQIVA